MCTLVILRRPDHEWPLIIAANRDEMIERTWEAPARHWSDRAHVTAGIDKLAGGTWLGVNDYGLVSGVLNRTGSLGPDLSLRSRGELPLEALDHAEVEEVAGALFDLNPHAYRPFNLFVADSKEAFWVSSLNEQGEPGMRMSDLPVGLSILTDSDLDDPASARVRRYLPAFKAANAPVLADNPDLDDWSAWKALLASMEFDDDAGPKGAMNIKGEDGFGTVSSSLIALPAMGRTEVKPRWLFAAGAPDQHSYEPIAL